MKDLASLFKAVVMPYTAVCAVSGIIFMAVVGQEIPTFVWAIFLGSLSEMGIYWSIAGLIKKVRG